MIVSHPVQSLLKLTSLLVIGACAWVIYSITYSIAVDLPRIEWWDLFYALPIMALMGCAAFYAYGLKKPTHTHLSLLVTLGFVMAVTTVPYWACGMAYLIFVADIAEPLNSILFWFYFVATLMLAIFVDWRLGKAAGFISADQTWWIERHIRGFCVFLAWWLLFGGMGWIDRLSQAEHLFVQPLGNGAETLVFLIFVAICVFTGIVLPRIAMSLTGITPAPRVPRRRRKGFHLWQSTEPIPPSASTESTP